MTNVVLLCAFWYVICTCSNIASKSVLLEFPHPMTVTMVQLTTTVTLLSLWGDRNKSAVENRNLDWGSYLKFIVPLAFGKFIGNLLNHVSIWKVPVSYAHTVRASMPLFTVLLSRLLLQEHQSGKIYLSLVPIVGGVALATITEISFNLIGLLSSLASTLIFALLSIFTKKVMHNTGIHHLSLLSITSKLSLLMFLPVWLTFDAQSILHSLTAVGMSGRTAGLLLLDGFLNYLHNVAIFSVISSVTPLTYAVANSGKTVFIIAVTLVVIGNPVSSANVFGMALAVAGVVQYNKIKFDEKQDKKIFSR